MIEKGHANILSLLDFSCEVKVLKTGKIQYIITEFFEFSNNSLEKEILNR